MEDELYGRYFENLPLKYGSNISENISFLNNYAKNICYLFTSKKISLFPIKTVKTVTALKALQKTKYAFL